MRTDRSNPTIPTIPLPGHEQLERIRPPLVYVTEEPVWEYKRLVVNLADQAAPGDEELNRLGAERWELCGVFVHQTSLYCYFKRPK